MVEISAGVAYYFGDRPRVRDEGVEVDGTEHEGDEEVGPRCVPCTKIIKGKVSY